MSQATSIGVPWLFSLVAIFIIIVIIASIVKVWLRGH